MTGNESEFVIGIEVESPPDDAPVTSHDNEHIEDAEAIQEVVKKAAEGNGTRVTVTPSNEALQEARTSLRPLPHYEGTDGPGGYYVEMGDDVVVITFGKKQ